MRWGAETAAESHDFVFLESFFDFVSNIDIFYNISYRFTICYSSVIGDDGSSTSVENVGTPKFDVFWNMVKDDVDLWVVNRRWPMATNSFILLLAYKEALSHEGKDTDNAAYRRFREMCRDFNIARMVL